VRHASFPFVAALAILLLAAPVAARDLVKVYKVQHRTAEELLPLVETALAGEGTAAADRGSNSLVLSGSSAAIAGALVLLAKLDAPLRTVVLRYESRTTRDLDAEGVRVAWSVDAGSVRIGNVIASGDGTQVAIAPEGTSRRREGALVGELRVMDGGSGRLSVGASAPVTTRRVDEGWRGTTVSESTTYVSADSGFEVHPRILGDGRIELALRPFESSLRPGGRVAYSTAETRLVLEPGTTTVVGGLLRDTRESRIDVPSGAGRASASDESLLLITAGIE
jgi:type II secretory pathway component GspD/PulD (secretin)